MNKFKERRRAAGYTLRRFCLEHNLDSVMVSKFERGKQMPSVEEQMRILDALISCGRPQ